MTRVKILKSILVLVSVTVGQSAAEATKLQARPLPSEREVKDFENGAITAPSVTRFQRRMDYREEERLRKEEEERAARQAADHSARAQALASENSQKKIKMALDANNRGVAAGRAGRFNEALAAHEEAVQLEPTNKQYVINLSAVRCAYGKQLLERKDLNAAANLFRKALSAAPDNALAIKLLNETMKKQGQDPTVADDRMTTGDQLLVGGDVASAMVEYQAAVQLEPSARTFTKMGDVALRLGQLATASNWYRQAIVKDADFGPAHRQMGMLQISQRDLTGAAASLRKAIIADPKDAVAGHSLVEIWRRQVAANPLLAENHLGLAGALQLTGDFNGADSEYNKLQALEPNNPSLAGGRASLARARAHAAAEKHRVAAETLFNQGLRREALAEISQAVMAEPKNDRYQFLLGECLEACGDLRGAHQAYLTAVLIDPERNKEAAYRMKEMQRGNTTGAAPRMPAPGTPIQAMPMQAMPVQQSAPQQHFQAPVQAAQPVPPVFRKNMFEGGQGHANVPAMPQSFAMHDESRPAQGAPATHQIQQAQNVAHQAPVHQAAAPQKPAQAPQAAPQDPAVTDAFARASEAESQRDYATAVASLRAVITSHLKNADLHHRLAVDLLAAGEIAESISEFRIASALRPENKAYAEDLARALAIHKRSTGESVPPASGKEVAAR